MADSGEISISWRRPLGLVAQAASRQQATVNDRILFIGLIRNGSLDRVAHWSAQSSEKFCALHARVVPVPAARATLDTVPDAG